MMNTMYLQAEITMIEKTFIKRTLTIYEKGETDLLHKLNDLWVVYKQSKEKR
jgi:hypothetical protein